MNTLINYLFGRMGKRTCPIIALNKIIDCSFNSPWREYYVITFKDGSTVELMEKPTFNDKNKKYSSGI